MKTVRLLLVLSFLIILCTLGLNAQHVHGTTNNALGLQTALDEIEKVTDELITSGKIEGNFDVAVKFNNVVTDDTDFELKILFLKFKKSKSSSITNSFTYKYKFSAFKRNNLKANQLKLDLAKTLSSGIRAYQNTTPNNLQKNGFTLTVGFTIINNGQGRAGVSILEPVTINASKRRQRKSVHTITMTFKPKKERS
jgi:hypothetical protein